MRLESHATVLQVPDVGAALDVVPRRARLRGRGPARTARSTATRSGTASGSTSPGPTRTCGRAYLYTDDVDALHAELVERGPEILQPPTDKGYGVRDLIVMAPSGHVLAIGQRLDG